MKCEYNVARNRLEHLRRVTTKLLAEQLSRPSDFNALCVWGDAGVLRGLIPPNTVTKEGPKLMEKGEVGWAGAGPGPDFFIYMGDRPAAHFVRNNSRMSWST